MKYVEAFARNPDQDYSGNACYVYSIVPGTLLAKWNAILYVSRDPLNIESASREDVLFHGIDANGDT